MYRFALRPRWLLSHAFALFVVVLFVNLGFWQLRRLDERRERNAAIQARALLDPVPIEELLAGAGDDPDSLRFRRVVLGGELGQPVVFVDNRSLGGSPGVWVVMPLTLDSGTVVALNRGFVFTHEQPSAPPAPQGRVEVVGSIVPWERDGCGTRSGDDGRLVGMACLNRSAFEGALGAEVAPVVVQRITSEPVEEDRVVPVPPPELGEGSHLSYAGQWFIFATIISVVYVLILRKNARERAVDAMVEPIDA